MDKQQLRELVGKPWFEWKLEDWKLVADSLSELLEAAERVEHLKNLWECELVDSTLLREKKAAAEAQRDRMEKALRKLKSYNEDIAAGRINYRPKDHIAVAAEALKEAENG